MTRIHRASMFCRTAVGTALAAALLAGCAGAGHLARATGSEKAVKAAGKDIARSEKAVEASPQDVSLRVALAHAYLGAGRFESAADAFADAQVLGDVSGGTALSRALAQIGAGRHADALTILDQYRQQIPAGDLGLALALAGDTRGGVAILSDAIRGGENTPKLRQNLAYAYALAGRWREARLMAAQDVPPDQIDQRISDWAMQVRPEDFRLRVAGLLSVPVRADKGEPQHLALAARADGPQFAAAAPVPAPASGELPALAVAEPQQPQTVQQQIAVTDVPAPAPAPAPVAPIPAPQPEPSRFAAAFTPAPAPEATQPGFEAPAAPRAPAPRRAATVRSASVGFGTGSTHLVQLGSFSSEARARAAWGIFTARNPQLRNYRMTITPAVVNGRNFWRVAAAGLDARGATGLCSSVRSRGGACIAYAATSPIPGAVPAHGNGGRMLARR